MKARNNFKILWHYLKDDKLKLLVYLTLVILSYIPGLLAAMLWGFALEHLTNMNFKMFLFFLALWEGSFIFCYVILSTPRGLLYNYLEVKFSKNVLKDLYHKITELPAYAFEEIGVGEFINRMVTDPDRVMELLSRLIKMSCKSIVVIVVFVIALKTSWVLGLEVLIFGIIMGIVSSKFLPKIKTTQENIKKESDKYVKTATENLTGIREIKALGIKKNIEKRIFKNFDDLFIEQSKIKNYEVIYYNINGLIYFILQFIILLTCGYIFIKGGMSLATFIIIESYIWRIDDVVESISDFGANYNKVSVSLKRIDEIVNNRKYKDEKFGKEELINTKGLIEFKNVKFKYKDDEEYTLKNLNLTLEPNKKIAIIGKSGNGKSTIFNLLLRYFDATEGIITIDGININDLTEESLRNNISIIRQTPFLFNISIKENFELVKPDVTLEEIRDLCKKSYIDEYIMSLPNKYDTIIGEGGVNLSGGQKQRLAIARALVQKTEIILFDEATSALDNITQEKITNALNNMKNEYTILIIAHRLSTIQNADRILYIEDGKIQKEGTHKCLLKNCKEYKELYETEIKNN